MKNNKLIYGAIGVVALLAIGGGLMVAVKKTNTGASKPTTNSVSNVPVVPVKANPINNTSNVEGLIIVAAAAEDNTDPATKAALTDRLQLIIKNTSTKPMANLEAYYTMTDVTTKQTEGYYQKLTGLSLAAGETKTINFDGQTGAGHYPENKYSIYRSSKNEVQFNIQVSAPGFKVAVSTAKKSVGTGEKAD